MQVIYVVDPTSSTTEFVSVKSIEEKGYNLHVNGLAEGTYYLVETKAPDGFNKLTAPIEVKITKSTTGNEEDWTLSKNSEPEEDKIIDVENSTGSLLPSTGGYGYYRIYCCCSTSCIRCCSKLYP